MPRYVLAPKIFKRYQSMGFNLKCVLCGLPLFMGDEVHTTTKRHGLGPRFYHAECFDSLLIDIPDHPENGEIAEVQPMEVVT